LLSFVLAQTLIPSLRNNSSRRAVDCGLFIRSDKKRAIIAQVKPICYNCQTLNEYEITGKTRPSIAIVTYLNTSRTYTAPALVPAIFSLAFGQRRDDT
jgi:hypothetical protein